MEGPELYHVGLVDTLQRWNWRKRLERWLKILVYVRCRARLRNGMSAVEPGEYARRFHLMVGVKLLGLPRDEVTPHPPRPSSCTRAFYDVRDPACVSFRCSPTGRARSRRSAARRTRCRRAPPSRTAIARRSPPRRAAGGPAVSCAHRGASCTVEATHCCATTTGRAGEVPRRRAGLPPLVLALPQCPSRVVSSIDCRYRIANRYDLRATCRCGAAAECCVSLYATADQTRDE